MHINSSFKLLQTRRRCRRSSASEYRRGRFNLRSLGRRRVSNVFRGGVETHVTDCAVRAGAFRSKQAQRDRGARLHELAGDAGITFFADAAIRCTTASLAHR